MDGEKLEISGEDWYNAPLHYPWQKHRASLLVNDGDHQFSRCSCGAFGPQWFMLSPDKPTYRKLFGPKSRPLLHGPSALESLRKAG